MLLFFCLAVIAAHSASKGSLGGVGAESKDIALICAENEAVLRGETPSIFPGVGLAELTICPSHCSGFGKLALEEPTLIAGDFCGVEKLTLIGSVVFIVGVPGGVATD